MAFVDHSTDGLEQNQSANTLINYVSEYMPFAHVPGAATIVAAPLNGCDIDREVKSTQTTLHRMVSSSPCPCDGYFYAFESTKPSAHTKLYHAAQPETAHLL